MPRKDLSLDEKIAILDKIKEQPQNTSERCLSEILRVPRATVGTLRRQEAELRQRKLIEGDSQKPRKRKREGKDPEVENALYEWFKAVSGKGITISGPILQRKAENIAKNLERKDFKATDGWLTRWKHRHNVQCKKFHRENKDSGSEAGNRWQWETLPKILKTFSPEDIYNADETGLYYCATPDGSLFFNRDNLVESEDAMDRLTVLCCVNMTGNDKKKLVVVGKSKKLRCLNNIALDRLPVEFHANYNASMTMSLFTEWLVDWDQELQRKSRSIVLVLKNRPAHPKIDALKKITLEFLPPQTAFLTQPLDMGIVKTIKLKYKAKLVQFIHEKIEETMLDETSTAIEVSSKVNILQAITFLADSWQEVSIQTIQNCFSYCGFERTVVFGEMAEEILEDDAFDACEIISTVQNFEEFQNLDADVACYDEYENLENATLGCVIKKQEASDGEEGEHEIPPVSLKEARQCMQTLQRFFLQVGNEDSPIESLKVCADYVSLLSKKNWRQNRVYEFFFQQVM